jgi:hypothetical protein
MKYQQFERKISDLWRLNMNRISNNSRKVYFIIGMTLSLLVVGFTFSIIYEPVQAAPGDATSIESANIRSGYCSASRSLVHKAILRRLDFTLSDGRGNAMGLRDEVATSGTPGRTGNLQHLDFALSDGRGNALGLRDDSFSLASSVLAAICP